MNTDSGKPTINIPHNQPVSMRRVPQLGDTLVVHGGERPAGADAPLVDAPTAKGLSLAETAAEDEALGWILGGREGATTDSGKIFADTPPAPLDGGIGDAPTSLAEQTAWLTPDGLKCWLVISPDPSSEGAATIIDHFTTYDLAREHVEATLASRVLVPGHGYDSDLMPGYTGFLAMASVPRDTLSEHHLAWVSPEGEKCWLVHEPDAGVTVYDVFTAAQARVNESEGRASFCVPHAGSDVPAPLEGFDAYLQPDGAAQAPDSGADAPRDTKPAGDGPLA